MDFLSPREIARCAATNKALFAAAVDYVQFRDPQVNGYPSMVIEGELGQLAGFRCLCRRVGWDVRKHCDCWVVCKNCTRSLPVKLCNQGCCVMACLPRCHDCNRVVHLDTDNWSDYFIMSFIVPTSGGVFHYSIECKEHHGSLLRTLIAAECLKLNRENLMKYYMNHNILGWWQHLAPQIGSSQYQITAFCVHFVPLILGFDPDHWSSILGIDAVH